jgi:hypothetical protein
MPKRTLSPPAAIGNYATFDRPEDARVFDFRTCLAVATLAISTVPTRLRIRGTDLRIVVAT